jgi:glycosyltransferase involved in cell wall biosynthesis
MPSVDRNLGALLFADRTVVLSRASEEKLALAGVSRDRLRRIAPAIAPPPPPNTAAVVGKRRALGAREGWSLLVYPGDLEFGRGAAVAVEALSRLPKAVLVMACRRKTARAEEAERRLREDAARAGVAERIRWVGEVPDVFTLLAAADAVLLATDCPYAKMDYPLVLLEAMALGRVVVVGAGTPAAELADGGGALLAQAAPDAVAEVVSRALANRSELAALGERARGTIALRHSPTAMASAYETLYDELLRT